MKAVRLHGRGDPDHLVYDDEPQLRPGVGEVLVRVYATGVIANELKWDATYQTKAGSPRLHREGHGHHDPAEKHYGRRGLYHARQRERR